MKQENQFINSKENLANALDAYYYREFNDPSDYDNILAKINNGEDIGLAMTTAEYDESMEFEATLKCSNKTIEYSVNQKVVHTETYNSFQEIADMLKWVSFDEFVADENFPGYSKYKEDEEK